MHSYRFKLACVYTLAAERQGLVQHESCLLVNTEEALCQSLEQQSLTEPGKRMHAMRNSTSLMITCIVFEDSSSLTAETQGSVLCQPHDSGK